MPRTDSIIRQIENRLRRLERQPKNAARQVILWDDGSGSAQIEAAVIEGEHGRKVEVVLVGWLPDASAT
jgi:L-lactate utilization protein LutC